MTRFVLAITLAFSALCLPVSAAPIPKAEELPPILGQAASLRHLFDTYKMVLANNLPPTLFKEFQESGLKSLNRKEISGFEMAKPFGFYAILNDRLDKCAGVVLIPITKEEEFLEVLREEWEAKIEKNEKSPGHYKIEPENEIVPLAIGMRFSEGYAYLCFGDQTAIDEKKIFSPKLIINEKEKAMATVTVDMYRVPKGLKAVFKELYVEKIETRINKVREDRPAEKGPDIEKIFAQAEVSLGKRYLDTLCDEVKTVRLRLEWNEKKLTTELEITPIEKSPLAKSYNERKPAKNPFGSLVTKEAMHYQTLQLPAFAPELCDAIKVAFDQHEKEISQRAIDQMLPQEFMVGIRELLKVGNATIKADGIDSIFVVNGPNKAGEIGGVFALKLKDADELAKKLPNAIKGMSEEMAQLVKVNATKIGTVEVHEIDLENVIPEAYQKLLGAKPKVLFAIGKDRGVVTFGANALDLMKQALEAKPTELSPRTMVLNGKKFKSFIDAYIEAAEIKNLKQQGYELIDMFGGHENLTLSEWTIKGGDKLTLRWDINNLMLYPVASSNIGWTIIQLGREIGRGAKPPAVRPAEVDPND